MATVKSEIQNAMNSGTRKPASTALFGGELASGVAIGTLFGSWLETYIPEAPPGSGAAFLTAAVPGIGHIVRNIRNRR